MKKDIFDYYANSVAKQFNITLEQLFTQTKVSHIVDARQILYFLCIERPIKKSYIKTFLQEQGYHVSHSTMEHGYKKAVQLINSDPDFQNMVKEFKKMIIEELNYIFEEALKDRKAIETKTKKMHSVIANGIKIQKFSDRIEILNMGKGGDYFQECTLEEYDYFYDEGWEVGCYKVKINNCLHKLKIIEENIKTEVNTRKNDKHIQNLKNRREKILQKYTINKNKLNQIKSNQNGKLL